MSTYRISLQLSDWSIYKLMHFFLLLLLSCSGVGKTTLVQKVWESLSSAGVSIHGFCTEEVRESGRRVGFDVVTVNGQRGILARVGYLSFNRLLHLLQVDLCSAPNLLNLYLILDLQPHLADGNVLWDSTLLICLRLKVWHCHFSKV